MAEKIEFDLGVKNNGLDKALDSATSKTSKLEGVLETALGVFGGNLITKGFELFTDGLNKAIAVGREAVTAAEEQEVATNNLNAALARSGLLYGENSKTLQDFASKMQETTTFTDETIQASESLLATLTALNTEGIQQGTKAAADFATVLGIDLETATRLVAKAANGNTEAFKRYGIEIQKGTTDAESFKNTIEALNKSFGGAATAQLNTYAGASKSLKNAYGELLEPLGNIIVKNPIVIATLNATKEIVIELTKSLNGNTGELQSFVQDGLLIALAVTESLFNGLDILTRAVKGTFELFKTGASIIGLGIVFPLKLAYDGVVLLLQQIPVLGKQFENLKNPLDGIADTLSNKIATSFTDFKKSVDDNTFTKLADGTAKLKTRILELTLAAATSGDIYKNSNDGRANSETETDAKILAERAKLGADLAALQLQIAAEQASQSEALRVASIENEGQRNAEQVNAIFNQKIAEAEATYQGELLKNAATQKGQELALANQIAFNKKIQAENKAANDRDIAVAKARVDLEAATSEQKYNIARASFGLAAALAKDGSKTQFAIQKAAALAEIAIADAKARALAIAQTALIPYPGNLAALAQMNALITATTAISAATVAAQTIKGFASGGVVGATMGQDNTVISAREGEMVLNADQQKKLFDMINAGGGGDIIIQVDGREIARAVRTQIQGGFRLA